LTCLQAASESLLQDASSRISLARILPHGFGVTIYDRLSVGRYVAASVALNDGRFDDAKTLIESLPAGIDRDDLAGQLLDAQGQHQAALEEFVRAGDAERVSRSVAIQRGGNLSYALNVQRALVTRLQPMDDSAELARAYWGLAQLESASGDHVDSSRDFASAVALIPFSETYLLGAANEALQFGKLEEARDYFARVVALDNASLDGHIGVGRVEAREGSLEGARREAEFVRAHNPNYRDLPVLEREISVAKSKP
jgi:tetratricopeptide (TPR) repeat protein